MTSQLTDEQLRQLRDDPLADYHHAGITAMAAELLALRARTAERCETCRRPRFSDRHLAQVTRERDELRARVAELEAEAQAEACATDEVRGDLNDALGRAAAAETARAALIASWEAEANQHRLTGHFGIAEGLRIAIDGLREVGEPTRSRPCAKAAGFFAYIPAVTRTGRGLEPADHHRVAQDPGPVAVWSDGPPEPPGRLIGYAVAFNDGGGWQVDTVRLDGSWDDAELRHHDWLSGGGYQARVVELREVGE